MLRNADTHTHRLDLTAPMKIFLGKCAKRNMQSAPVIGRLIFEEKIDSFSGNEALLAIVDGSYGGYAAYDGRTVGMVCISDKMGDTSDRMPQYPCITLSELPRDCNGKIALLDPKTQRLYVSPDIVTVNRYTALFTPSCNTDGKICHRLSDGKKILISVIPDDISDLSFDADGFILNPFGCSTNEEDLYSIYTDIAECAVGQAVEISLSVKNDLECSIRALLRSAVWGEVSLLFSDVLTEDGLTKALDGFHKVFCELEAEGREFNGYIQRGLRIDSPYLFSRASDLCGVDTFVYDAEGLAVSLGGNRQKLPRELTDSLCLDIRKLSEKRRDVKHSVILGNNTLTEPFCRGLIDSGISSYAVPVSKYNELQVLLLKALREDSRNMS